MRKAIGFDVGGTFTDLALVDYDTGTWHCIKVPTTVDDRAVGCLAGIKALLQEGEAAASDVIHIAHGSTVVTNTILERSGAKTALITTRGFRDVLEIRRQVMPERYDAYAPKPIPLVPREMRFEVNERTLADGSIEVVVDEEELSELIELLNQLEVEAVAICFLHSYANPTNEKRAEELVSIGFKGFVTSSHRVLNEMREYERTSSVVANAYVAPRAEGYLGRIEKGARELGIEVPVLMFQSNGGLASMDRARELPISTLLSGPAAGVTGACALAEEAGTASFITLDMGGTSCDVALIRDGKPTESPECDASGWPVRFPRLAIHTVGAGGGSIAWIDPGGLVTVGPQSSGANPGPACYGLGGSEATVTDAHVVLGRISAEFRLGGRIAIDSEAAEKVVATLGARAGLPLEQVATAILDVVNATMVQAIRVISVEKGIDPRGLPLVAFGGAGPLHACDLARELRLDRIIVPASPGVLCALGVLAADLRIDGSRTHRFRLTEASAHEIVEALTALESDVRNSSAARQHEEAWQATFVLGMRYSGQAFELPVPLSTTEIQTLDLSMLAEKFDQVHEGACGYANPSEPREVLSLRVVLNAPAGERLRSLPAVQTGKRENPYKSTRAYFKTTGWVDCPVYERHNLPVHQELNGPAIVAQMDSTIVVNPGFSAISDNHGNLVMHQV